MAFKPVRTHASCASFGKVSENSTFRCIQVTERLEQPIWENVAVDYWIGPATTYIGLPSAS